MNTDKILYLLRAVPGAGKTTFANTLNADIIIEADHYFDNYSDDKTKSRNEVWAELEAEGELYTKHLYLAHQQCYTLCRKSMEDSLGKIVISNTNIKMSDLKPYKNLAEEFGYTIFILIIENHHNNESVNNVPIGVSMAMVDDLTFKFHPNMEPTNLRGLKNQIKNLKGIKIKSKKKKKNKRKPKNKFLNKIKGFYYRNFKSGKSKSKKRK